MEKYDIDHSRCVIVVNNITGRRNLFLCVTHDHLDTVLGLYEPDQNPCRLAIKSYNSIEEAEEDGWQRIEGLGWQCPVCAANRDKEALARHMRWDKLRP
jgi:hypothetical protein